MNEYFNATGGVIELPIPNGLGVRRLSPGQSFFGSVFYERFIQQGKLAKASASTGSVRGIVNSTDVAHVNAVVSDATAPYRYKSNGSNTSLNQIKYFMYMGLDTLPGDNVLVVYYFYCNFAAASTPSHVIPRYEPLTSGWRFPTWADLPSYFYGLDPIQQIAALMTTA